MSEVKATFPNLAAANAALGAVIVAREGAGKLVARTYAMGETPDTSHLEQLQGAEQALRDAMRIPARTGLPVEVAP